MSDINQILATPAYDVSSKWGAPMGRCNQCDGVAEKLHLQKVKFVDGDYDAGGAYWGGGKDSDPLWCAFSPEDTENKEPVMIFVRANSWAEAKEKVLEEVKEDGFSFAYTPREVDLFTQHFIIAALWATSDESDPNGGEPLDSNYDEEDLSDEALQRIKKECQRFQRDNAVDLTPENCLTKVPYIEQAGHDFFLTRNGHGSGFWERSDWKEEAGARLTASAKKFGELNIYVGDDGKLHI